MTVCRGVGLCSPVRKISLGVSLRRSLWETLHTATHLHQSFGSRRRGMQFAWSCSEVCVRSNAGVSRESNGLTGAERS